MREKGSVVVAMSGGVDSSAAAARLLGEGWRVTGVTFRMWEGGPLVPDSAAHSRCSLSAVENASAAARKLGIDHVVIDLRDAFDALVIEPFVREYIRGRTPNPCVECNQRVKFPALAEAVDEMGADAVATGHYARVCVGEGGGYTLLRAVPREKDQSYALYRLGREVLSRCLFPNGKSSKAQVRAAAISSGLAVTDIGESQEICFLCGGDYRDFIASRRPEASTPGPILDTRGEVLGEHRGIAFYTVGQRRGLGVSRSRPLYVVEIDASRRAVILGSREEVPGTWLRAGETHWTGGVPPAHEFEAEAMVRYNASSVPCRVKASEDATEAFFGTRVWALTPGQHAVIYRGDKVLGGGVIVSAR